MKTEIRQKFIVGNWKMHTTSFEAQQLAKGIVDGLAAPFKSRPWKFGMATRRTSSRRRKLSTIAPSATALRIAANTTQR